MEDAPTRPAASPPGRRRVSVRYEGRVQGVGFRYTVYHLAADCAVTGFVRNEPDGSVRLCAEGAELELLRLLELIRQSHLGRGITAEYPQWGPANNAWPDFRIAF